jgi:hypothetical protein
MSVSKFLALRGTPFSFSFTFTFWGINDDILACHVSNSYEFISYQIVSLRDALSKLSSSRSHALISPSLAASPSYDPITDLDLPTIIIAGTNVCSLHCLGEGVDESD